MGKMINTFRDFSGGLSEVANDNMKNNELIQAVNIVPGDGYGISRCTGTSIAYAQIKANTYVKRVIELTTATETQTLAFVTSDGIKEEIYKWDSTNKSWVELAVGANAILPIKSWYIYANKLYWLDGTAFRVYDGTTIGTPTLTYVGSPSAELQTAFKAKIDKAVSATRRGTQWFYVTGADELIFSEIGNPLSFTVTNIINVTTPDNDALTAVTTFNDALLIWKKRTVHHLSGWDFANGSDIKLMQLNVTSGTVWPDTIKTIENGVLYLGINGIYKLYVPYSSSLIAAQNISDKKISNRITEGAITGARAEVFSNVYYLSLDQTINGTLTNREYRYFVSDKSFYGEFTQGVYSYMPFLNNTDKLYLGSKNGYVLYYTPDSSHYINTNTGEPIGIPIVAKTKGFDVIGNMFQDAKVKKIFISAKQYESESTNLTVQIKADYADAAYATAISSMDEILSGTTGLWGFAFDEALVYSEGEWGHEKWGWLETISKEITIGRKCKRLQFIFAGEHAEPLLIYGIGIIYKKKKVKGNREGVSQAALTYPEG